MLTLVAALVGSASCPGLPLIPGTTWTYRVEAAWAVGATDSTGRSSFSWTTTVTTVRASDSAVAATVTGWPSALAWWTPGRPPSTSVLYCAGGRVYLFRVRPGEANRITEALLNGQQKPASDDLIFRFPLHAGDLFGRDAADRRDTFYAWFVEGTDSVPAALRPLLADVADSLYSVIYRTIPDYTLVGVAPGLGIVHYVYRHHGTTAEAEAWLVRYQPGSPSDGSPRR